MTTFTTASEMLSMPTCSVGAILDHTCAAGRMFGVRPAHRDQVILQRFQPGIMSFCRGAGIPERLIDPASRSAMPSAPMPTSKCNTLITQWASPGSSRFCVIPSATTISPQAMPSATNPRLTPLRAAMIASAQSKSTSYDPEQHVQADQVQGITGPEQ